MAETAGAAFGVGKVVDDLETDDGGHSVESHLGDAGTGFDQERFIGLVIEEDDTALATIVGINLADKNVSVEMFCLIYTAKQGTVIVRLGSPHTRLFFGVGLKQSKTLDAF